MTIDLSSEHLLSLAEAAKTMPGRPHSPTIRRRLAGLRQSRRNFPTGKAALIASRLNLSNSALRGTRGNGPRSSSAGFGVTFMPRGPPSQCVHGWSRDTNDLEACLPYRSRPIRATLVSPLWTTRRGRRQTADHHKGPRAFDDVTGQDKTLATIARFRKRGLTGRVDAFPPGRRLIATRDAVDMNQRAPQIWCCARLSDPRKQRVTKTTLNEPPSGSEEGAVALSAGCRENSGSDASLAGTTCRHVGTVGHG